jgi:cytochrome c oxidase subunit 2
MLASEAFTIWGKKAARPTTQAAAPRASWAGLASGGGAGRTIVKVTGGQFFWSLAPDSVPAGARVRFDITSVDVNHGFGLYDPHGHLIGSVQAMPGYHNKLDFTLNEPGVYRIRCLELCGLNHSTMENTFTVTRR